jgi:hypothetical protein
MSTEFPGIVFFPLEKVYFLLENQKTINNPTKRKEKPPMCGMGGEKFPRNDKRTLLLWLAEEAEQHFNTARYRKRNSR